MSSSLKDFRIDGLIGSGGAACTYEALHLKTNQRVALKTLSKSATLDEKVREAFILEAKLAAELSHPNLVACVDMNVESRQPWIAFELIEGASVADVLRTNDFLDANWAMNIATDIAYGLTAAHQKGILHRDIKPTNILFSAEGFVKLIDFGAAYVEKPGTLEMLSNGQHTFSGTPEYASPEQLKGDVLDERSDLYSLGLVLYEMLTGKRVLNLPQESSGVDSAMAVFKQQSKLLDRLPAPSEVRPNLPQGLDEILFGMLAFRPAQRAFSSALEFVSAIDCVLALKGWHYEHRDVERQVAHEELAEVAYWRALSHLAEDRFHEAVELFASLFHHPAHIYAKYYHSLKKELCNLLDRQMMLHISSEPDGKTLFLWAKAALGVTQLAHTIDAPELALLAERRMLTLIDWLDDAKDSRNLLNKYAVVQPFAMAANLRRPKSFKTLVEATDNDGWFEKTATLMKHPKFQELGKMEQKAMSKSCKEYLANKKTFASVIKELQSSDKAAVRLQICHRFTEDNPTSFIGWFELAKTNQILGQAMESAKAYHQAAILAFRREQWKKLDECLKNLLTLDPNNKVAHRMLLERLYSEGQLPRRYSSLAGLETGILIERGFVKAAEITVKKVDYRAEEGEILEELKEHSHNQGYLYLVAEIDFLLGSLCLAGELWDEGLELFSRALEGARDPLSLLNKMDSLPNIRQIFSPLKLLTLRRELTAA